MWYEWTHRTLLLGPNLRICLNCRSITEDPDYSRPDRTTQPCCGIVGDSESWPSQAVVIMREVVHHRDSLVDDGNPVRFVFLAAMMEALFEPLVFEILSRNLGQQGAEKLLAMNHGAYKLRQLFNKHASVTLAQAAKALAIEDILRSWELVSKVRNKMAHGTGTKVGSSEKSAAEVLESRAFHGVSKLHNLCLARRPE